MLIADEQGEIITCQANDDKNKIDENVWLTQTQLVGLYQSSKSNVSEHIKHIYEEGKLEKSSTVRNSEQLKKRK